MKKRIRTLARREGRVFYAVEYKPRWWMPWIAWSYHADPDITRAVFDTLEQRIEGARKWA